jgi:hypothetical protein
MFVVYDHSDYYAPTAISIDFTVIMTEPRVSARCVSTCGESFLGRLAPQHKQRKSLERCKWLPEHDADVNAQGSSDEAAGKAIMMSPSSPGGRTIVIVNSEVPFHGAVVIMAEPRYFTPVRGCSQDCGTGSRVITRISMHGAGRTWGNYPLWLGKCLITAVEDQ